jgi:hypothetical protein
LNSETEERKRRVFDTLIEKRWGSSMNPPKRIKDGAGTDSETEWEPYEDDEEGPYC